jgi:hypothetical protein
MKEKTQADWLGWVGLVILATAVWSVTVLFGLAEPWQALAAGNIVFGYIIGWGISILLFDAIEAHLRRP